MFVPISIWGLQGATTKDAKTAACIAVARTRLRNVVMSDTIGPAIRTEALVLERTRKDEVG
jgi:hypothetical protein